MAPPRWLKLAVLATAVVLAAGLVAFWPDLVATSLDPKVPFQTYRPPPAPNYAEDEAWWLKPRAATDLKADVFFISPTTYDGGRHWNGPVDDLKSAKVFREVMAPNYVGPFAAVGRIFAPKYRQASLYSKRTLREDAREARQFAYGDVRNAFREYLARDNGGRPFFIVGVEQGGNLGLRLLAEELKDPGVRGRVVAAYLIDTIAPADTPPLPPCAVPGQTGCLAAWSRVYEDDFDGAQRLLDRALVWNDRGELVNLKPRPALCFNPVLGAVTTQKAEARQHLGAANATGLEWGARPAFMARQVAARCEGGVLRVTKPKSPSLQRRGSWSEKKRVFGFNLFWADIEADAKARLAAMTFQ